MSNPTPDGAESHVLVARDRAIARITLNRPDTLNALTNPMFQAIQRAFTELADDTLTRVVILQGAGENFCAGADMSLLLNGNGQDESYAMMRQVSLVVETMRAIPQPLICKLEGVAYGGGLNIALNCDIVVATENARLCEAFSNIGLNLDCGGTYALPRLVGLSRARALALLGEEIDGRTAAEMGLIYAATAPHALEAETEALASRLAKKSPGALSAIKHGLDRSLAMDLSESLEWEATRQAELLQTPELKTAALRFLESRGKKQGA